MESLNQSLFLALNASAHPPAAVVFTAIVAARYLIALVPLHIGLLWVGGSRVTRRVALTAIVALALALAANQVIGLVAYVPRPFQLGLGHQLIEHRPSSSFPSNHGTIMFTYAMVLAYAQARRLAVLAGCLGLLVAWSRIYLGVHFPMDMLGAALVSAAAAFLAHRIIRRHADALVGGLERLTRRVRPDRRSARSLRG